MFEVLWFAQVSTIWSRQSKRSMADSPDLSLSIPWWSCRSVWISSDCRSRDWRRVVEIYSPAVDDAASYGNNPRDRCSPVVIEGTSEHSLGRCHEDLDCRNLIRVEEPRRAENVDSVDNSIRSLPDRTDQTRWTRRTFSSMNHPLIDSSLSPSYRYQNYEWLSLHHRQNNHYHS